MQRKITVVQNTGIDSWRLYHDHIVENVPGESLNDAMLRLDINYPVLYTFWQKVPEPEPEPITAETDFSGNYRCTVCTHEFTMGKEYTPCPSCGDWILDFIQEVDHEVQLRTGQD